MEIYRELVSKIDRNSKICIWGANKFAQNFINLIREEYNDIKIEFIIDSNYEEEFFEDILVITPDKIIEEVSKIDLAIITSFSAKNYMEFILKNAGLEKILAVNDKFFERKVDYNSSDVLDVFDYQEDKDLYLSLARMRKNPYVYGQEIRNYHATKYSDKILGYSIKQYLEFINKDVIKTVIDGGAYNCLQSLIFLNSFSNCEQVYAFEPCYGDFKDKTLDSIIKTKEQIKIIPKGLWGESTVLKFRKETEHKVGSAIVEVKPCISRPQEIIELQVTSIDDFVGDVDKKIDFIKMDIEGAELSALEGAIETIRKDRPQLAISIYHTDEHFYKIPLYLKEKLSDYVFRLAHYDCNWCETVLYAIPRELYLKN